jgi:predicted nucleotidyltransferase
MKTVDQITKLLAKHKAELKDRFKVAEIGVFGSYVRKEQNPKSDVDILVSFSETIDLFQFIELENYLSDVLGVKVDLVMKEGLKPRLRDRSLSEAVYV